MTRLCAVGAPLLLLTYGLLHRLDGARAAFLLSMLLFALLATLLRPLADSPHPPRHTLATTATAATVLGAASLGLTTATGPAIPEPWPLLAALLFQLGLVTLVALLAAARPSHLPTWSPYAVLAGCLGLTAVPALLPVAALAIGAGLAPLALTGSLPARPRSRT
ncbi:hypothetical protein [Catenuloplanes atrovinosus]|uniref:Uncharacterized protein n=1 Tax=Catenuloplanes atrovinosus TaxID=137266 RepID=A0AAE3YTH0_9ACTN|nr:hypothetical protein [Catenuloplanes atrovinosus]MDR7278356.1 hypothetical protein [Catenuloplanes atrovinosus]